MYRISIGQALFLFLLFCPQLAAQPSQRNERLRVPNERITPHWFANSTRMWYQRDKDDSNNEFVVVDLATGTKTSPFDSELVSSLLNAQSNKGPIQSLRFSPDGQRVFLMLSDVTWEWKDKEGKLEPISLEELDRIAPAEVAANDGRNDRRRQNRTGVETDLVFENRWTKTVEIFWLSGTNRVSYGKIGPGETRSQHTFGGHRWLITDEEGKSLGFVVANDTSSNHIIDGTRTNIQPEGRSGRDRRPANDGRDSSNARKAEIRIVNGNIVLVDENGTEIPLSTDGTEANPYSDYSLSPDSKSLVAFRANRVEAEKVYRIQSSPVGGGRAVLQSNAYTLPGDPMTTYELNLFNIDSKTQIKPKVDSFEHEWQHPNVRWSKTGEHFYYTQVDRGHQRFRLMEGSPNSTEVRNAIDETTKTFIWTAHTENQNLPILQWLENSEACIYASEQSGYRHLYLVDLSENSKPKPITSGSWVVREVDRIDEEKRQVWFRASGVYPNQDPYLIHFGRVSFDGTGLTWLTAGDGMHSLQFSPKSEYYVDSYSRVDLPPVHELRRSLDGGLVCSLETVNGDLLRSKGWSPPEVFQAKGRDGITNIWGIICRPRNFDPKKKYPIIEDIYAGPQSSYVPKNFSVSDRFGSLTELGFIVVKIDGMGTANRSKAFHDVCWHNLKDAGFDDRIKWIQAAAKKYPAMDLDRVGIYGTSAGGQNAAGAVLFHPEFYKAAVAACGCHDNRMDKASWNEQWMGYPVGPHYSESSNIDNASKLGGKLLLIVGEVDDNVPPESTLRFVDALIRANKDFDFLMVPNAGHGMGGGYGVRKMHEFFVRHLKP